jgi:hypothetical protein
VRSAPSARTRSRDSSALPRVEQPCPSRRARRSPLGAARLSGRRAARQSRSLRLADREVSAVVEQLARFRTQRLQAALLRRRGLPLALAALELNDRAEVVDLDDPRVLVRERLRPSEVATRHREVTQPQARALHSARPRAAALRWWSTLEASWANYTVFDRALSAVAVLDVRELTIEDAAVTAAADFLGLRR